MYGPEKLDKGWPVAVAVSVNPVILPSQRRSETQPAVTHWRRLTQVDGDGGGPL